MKVYTLETEYHTVSWYLFLSNARAALDQFAMKYRGRRAEIIEHDLTGALYAFGVMVLFGAIGVILAWRG